MKLSYYSMLLAFVMFSCGPLKQGASSEMSAPSIGAIGKQDKSLLNTNFKQVGEPVLTSAIALSATAVPFTKSTFKEYANTKAQKGEKVSISYVDALPNKPKYLRFEIKDKIGLKTLLNSAENTEVRSYLTKDGKCKIVSSISVYLDEMPANDYVYAEGLFLTTDNNGLLRIQVVNGKQKHLMILSKNEIFDYDVMGFCWGENRYGKPQIEILSTGGSCPNGTEKNAQKLDDLQTFLKL